MHCHTEGNEFYMLVRGYELKQFPDVPIVCHPLLNTSTHKLALETNPQWCLRVRHKGHWRIKTRAKVRVYPEGNGKCPAISFALPAQARFESPDSVFAALAKVDYSLTLHDIRPAVHKRVTLTSDDYAKGFEAGKEEGRYLGAYEQQVTDPFELLAEWNERESAALKARRPKLLPVTPTAEIIDIAQFLKDKGVEMPETGVVRATA